MKWKGWAGLGLLAILALKMTINTYGHAKVFFIPNLLDGALNEQRALTQYHNPSQSKPEVNDLLIYSPTLFNPYGHVAIGITRQRYRLIKEHGQWRISKKRVLGWLRKN